MQCRMMLKSCIAFMQALQPRADNCALTLLHHSCRCSWYVPLTMATRATFIKSSLCAQDNWSALIALGAKSACTKVLTSSLHVAVSRICFQGQKAWPVQERCSEFNHLRTAQLTVMCITVTSTWPAVTQLTRMHIRDSKQQGAATVLDSWVATRT